MTCMKAIAASALMLTAAGCVSTAAPKTPTASVAAEDASLDPRVKFKDGARLQRQLALAFHLPADKVCLELGRYDCNDDAFLISLGGVEPEHMLVYSPIEEAALAAPIAVDRVALHACSARVDLDVEAPSSAVLMQVSTAAQKADSAWRAKTVAHLYDVVLGRMPSKVESDALVSAYDEVASGRPAAEAMKDWTKLSCFAVVSSLENLFY